MLIKTLTRRVVPAAAVFAVLGGALVAQDRIATDDLSVEPAILTEHALQARADGPVEKRLSPDHHDEADSADGTADTQPIEHLEEGHLVAELPRTDMKDFSLLGVTWTKGLTDDEAGTLIEVQTRGDDGKWTGWQSLHIEPGQDGRPGTEPLWVGDSDGVAVRVLSAGSAPVKGLSLATIDPGKTPEVTSVANSLGQPPIIMRSSWGAKSNTSCDSPRYGDATLGAVIHHTVGSNSYTKAQSAGIVKGIQSYHMGSRKWCDIGYNFLVDKYGQIFEGRAGGIDKPVRAAHAGNGAVNQQTMGVSLMGTFTTANPTTAMKNATADLVAWRFSLEGVPAQGTYKLGGLTLNRISGHRNVVSTECPGATVYRWLSASGGLRDMVESRLKGLPSVVGGISKSSVGLTDATVSWNAVTGAVKYRIYVTDTADMPYNCEPNCEVITPSNLSSPSWKLTGLKASTPYYVKISAIGSDGHTLTTWQDEPMSFATDVGGIETTEVGATSMNLKWTPVTGAAKYRIYASPSSSMPSTCEPNCQVITPSNLNAPSFNLTGLKAGGTYYVKISALNSAGRIMTDWQEAPVKVALTSIPSTVQNITGSADSATSMTLRWDAVPTAVKYRVYASTSSSMPSSCEPNCKVVTPSDLADPSYTWSGLSSGKAYYVKVSAINAAGKTITGWQSSPVKVQLASAGTIPSTVQNITGSADSATSMTVRWDAVPTAAKYRIYASPSATMPGTCEPHCQVVTPADLTSPSFHLTGLDAGKAYYVKVSAINAAGKTITGWQATPVKVQLAAVTVPSTVQSISGTAQSPTSMTVKWDAVPTATKYRIYASPSATMPYNCEPYCQVVTPTNLSAPSFQLTGLAPGATYHLKVSAINAAGKTITSWQDQPVVVQLPAGTIPSAVQNVAGTAQSSTSMAVSWDPVSTAVKYRVYASTSSSMPSSCEPNCKVVTPSDLADPSYTWSGLSSGKAYYVKVSAINAAGKTITGWQSSPVKVQLMASSAKDSITVPSSRTISVKGHGYGHGNGMSQYGAEGGAREGKTYSQILAHYYPGTALGSKTGNIRVLLSADTTDSVMVEAASGITFRQGSTSFALPTTIDGKKVIRWSIDPVSTDKKKSTLRYRTSSVWQVYQNRTWTGEAQFEAATLKLVMPDDSNRTYRTTLRSALPKSGATNRDTVNVLSIENYTRGVVAREMPSSWHAEALKAQAVAARTYGVRGLNSSKYYDMCDTTSCQVYGGVAAETAATDAAVSGTSGKILTYSGTPAFTQFSSSSGGYTNKGSQPYLKPISDPWDGWSGNKNHAWTISVKASTIEKKYSSIGTLKSLSVTKRNGYGDMGGRVTSVKLTGSKGSKTISGVDARWAFGLKSDWFGF